MSERKMVCVVVFDQEQYDGAWPPEDPAGFIGWFQEKINEIPLEHRGEAKIEIGSVLSYEDSHYAKLEITYWRPETDAEATQRRSDEAANARVRQEAELRTLAALKAKYEPSSPT